MNTKTKLTRIAIVCFFIVFLTSCSSSGFNNSELMRPPRATGNKAEIQAIIESKSGGDYTLKYPQKGKIRSAIIMDDIDNDGVEEAIALYKPAGDVKTGIHILIIDEIDGEWVSIGDYTNQSTEVDRIYLADLNGDSKKEILIGWSTYSPNVNQLTGYIISNNTTKEITIASIYSDMTVTDLTGEGIEDVILLNLSPTEASSTASILQYNKANNSLVTKSSTSMDNSVTFFSNVLPGKIDQTHSGVFVDGLTVNNSVLTQLLYYENGLKNPLFKPENALRPSASVQSESTSVTNVTNRSTTTVCKDINNDGLIEIPTVSLMNNDSSEPIENVGNIIAWNNYRIKDEKLIPSTYTVPNYSDGYYFVLPKKWENTVTARIDTSKRQLIFYEWVATNKTSSKGKPLLTIQVFPEKDWLDRKNTDGYTEMNSGAGLIYAVYLPETQSNLALTLSEVSDNLKLIKSN